MCFYNKHSEHYCSQDKNVLQNLLDEDLQLCANEQNPRGFITFGKVQYLPNS